MIIFADKGFQTRSDKPNEDWTNGEPLYVVPDKSDIAKKIQKMYPWYNFVLNNLGELVDVEWDEDAYREYVESLPPDPEPETEPVTWDALAEAYKKGVESIG